MKHFILNCRYLILRSKNCNKYTLKKLEKFKNFKQLKISKNILKVMLCLENDNLTHDRMFPVSTINIFKIITR